MEFRIPFSGRAHTYSEEEVATAVEAMQHAVPLTQGRYLNAFEEKFKHYVGAPYAHAVCNATAALEIAAQLCCFNEGDEVVIPAHTFTATAYPFLKKGAIIVWADIDPQTRVVNVQTLEKCITDKTRALVVVHLYGYGADMPAIMELARQNNLLVVEDCAQALGVKVEEQMVGTFGDFGVYSFHSHKNMTTLGEGGMLVTQQGKYANIIPMLRHNGHCGFEEDRDDYWIPAMGNVDMPELDGNLLFPNNYCIGEVECAIGVRLLDRIDAINSEKRSMAMAFMGELNEFHELEFHCIDNDRHNYHLLVAKVANGWRDEFIRRMSNDHGIQCVVQYCPLNRYPLYIKSGLGDAQCPDSDEFFDNMVSFPFHHMIESADIDTMISAAKSVLTDLRA